MEFNISEEKIREVAKRYGFQVSKVDNPEKAGFYIEDEKISADDLFGFLFPCEEEE